MIYLSALLGIVAEAVLAATTVALFKQEGERRIPGPYRDLWRARGAKVKKGNIEQDLETPYNNITTTHIDQESIWILLYHCHHEGTMQRECSRFSPTGKVSVSTADSPGGLS